MRKTSTDEFRELVVSICQQSSDNLDSSNDDLEKAKVLFVAEWLLSRNADKDTSTLLDDLRDGLALDLQLDMLDPHRFEQLSSRLRWLLPQLSPAGHVADFVVHELFSRAVAAYHNSGNLRCEPIIKLIWELQRLSPWIVEGAYLLHPQLIDEHRETYRESIDRS
ncbi:hypothetical protein [Rhodopirellula sp. MGV]|uniref:hypothetical protein n=1 Tax=Rhodopirellula sp. MGV TaxID=2023130 RepID=UPI000B97C4FA|nr:hypothetical protein [Rhodopirellula sp. MGV]OYP33811.1 hypothetical protein CGZ80_17860 [Rhodopirellula sp. MGV]PNY37527.1 hypothetical protein C2E31_07285 [Rhodopirellula baltica]